MVQPAECSAKAPAYDFSSMIVEPNRTLISRLIAARSADPMKNISRKAAKPQSRKADKTQRGNELRTHEIFCVSFLRLCAFA
jgi:hypothetical protein